MEEQTGRTGSAKYSAKNLVGSVNIELRDSALNFLCFPCESEGGR